MLTSIWKTRRITVVGQLRFSALLTLSEGHFTEDHNYSPLYMSHTINEMLQETQGRLMNCREAVLNVVPYPVLL